MWNIAAKECGQPKTTTENVLSQAKQCHLSMAWTTNHLSLYQGWQQTF